MRTPRLNKQYSRILQNITNQKKSFGDFCMKLSIRINKRLLSENELGQKWEAQRDEVIESIGGDAKISYSLLKSLSEENKEFRKALIEGFKQNPDLKEFYYSLWKEHKLINDDASTNTNK